MPTKSIHNAAVITIASLALVVLAGCARQPSDAAVAKSSPSSVENSPQKKLKSSLSGCIDPDLSQVSTSQQLTLCDGTIGAGTLDLANLAANNLKVGVVMGGVEGSAPMESHSDCVAEGAIGCVSTSAFPVVLIAGLSVKIRSGETVAGVVGSYIPDFPAAGHVLSTDTVNGVAGTLALPEAGKILSGTSCGVAGNGSTGALILPGAGSVLSGTGTFGDPGSLVTPTYIPDFPSAANVRSSDTVDGTAGTIADCLPNSSNCYVPGYVLTTQPLKAINFDSISAGVVKNGVVIAGVIGDYPSSTYPLPNSGAAGISTDLTSFATQVTTNGSFQFWDSAGVRHTGSGDSDIIAANVRAGVAFENVSVAGSTVVPDVWDVRAGSAVGTTTGKLRVNCRNGGSTLSWGMGPTKSTVVTNAADTLTMTAHGFNTGDALQASYTTQPTGLSTNSDYYVIKIDNDTIKLATSAANATALTPIDITADGSGVVTWAVGGTPKVASVANGTEQLTVAGHGYATAQAVKISYTTQPTGLNLNTLYYVIIVDANTIKLATNPGGASIGTAIDITADGTDVYVFSVGTGTLTTSDTIDDYNYGSTALTAHPWSSSNNFCSGVAATAADDNVWLDVTSGGGCGLNPSGCRYKDKISGLMWTKTQSTGMYWGRAINYCENLTFDGLSGWRLPTQKELLDAYGHGIRSASSSSWIVPNDFWSSTSVSTGASGSAWFLRLYSAYTYSQSKSASFAVLYITCVQ